MKNVNYYSRKSLYKEIKYLNGLLEQLELKNNLLHKVAAKYGYTAIIDININANNLNHNYYQGRLTGIKFALRLMQ